MTPSMKMRRTGARARHVSGIAGVAAVVAAGLLLSACSSSSQANGDGKDATGSTDGNTATGSTWKIATVASITGPYAGSIGGVANVVKAWQAWTNAHGGVAGHKIEVSVKDDGGVPSKGLSAVKQLVNDHVAAIVGPASNTVQSWYKLTDAAKIPVVGGQTNGGSLYQTDPLLFPTGTTAETGVFNVAKKAGKYKLGVLYCSEVPICASTVTTVKNQLKKDAELFPDTKVVYSGAVSGSAPNYASACLAAKQAGVDVMSVSDGAAVTLRVAQDCASQGYKPMFIGAGASADNTWLKASVFDGIKVILQNFPWYASATPAQQNFQKALKQYASSEPHAETFNANDSQVWAALEVFKAAIEKAKPTTLSSQTVLDAMHALPEKFSIPSITPPLTYSKSGPNPGISCYFTAQIKDGKWTAPGTPDAICPS